MLKVLNNVNGCVNWIQKIIGFFPEALQVLSSTIFFQMIDNINTYDFGTF